MPPAEPRRPASDRRRPPGAEPVWLFGGLVALLLLARAVEVWQLPLPACGFKSITGWPCAFCGTTRAACAVARFDFAGALRLNPLACGLGALVVIGLVVWAADRWLGTNWGRLTRNGVRVPWICIGLGALALNWFYVLWVAAGR